MKGNIFKGFGHLYQGFRLLSKPGIWPYVVVPLIINLLLFSLMISYAYQQFNEWIIAILDWLPGWLSFVDWLLWVIFGLLILFIVIFSFNLLANLIAAPFNGFLAEAVERYLLQEPSTQQPRTLTREVLVSIARELRKMAYYLPRALMLFLVGLIPFITPVAPALWFLFGGWMMAIQYLDYPMDNHRISFARMRLMLQECRLTPLGFGSGVLLVSMVPLLNLIIIPAAVAGATRCWVEDFR